MYSSCDCGCDCKKCKGCQKPYCECECEFDTSKQDDEREFDW